MDPLTVSEGFPKWLQALYLSLDDEKYPSAEKAIFVTLVVLMYETGFYLDGQQPNVTGSFDIAVMRGLPSAISLIKEQGSYKLTFAHFGASNPVILLIIPLDFAFIVNLMVKNEKVVTLALNGKDFVSTAPSVVPLVNVKSLSLLFKEKIFAAKSLVVDETFNPHHILHLPVEIIAYILKHLSPCDFCRFGTTCTKANSFLEDDKIWKIICKSKFPGLHLTGRDTWKELVKYSVKKEINNSRRPFNFCDSNPPFAIMGPLI